MNEVSHEVSELTGLKPLEPWTSEIAAILGKIKQKIASSLTLLAMTVRNVRGSLRPARHHARHASKARRAGRSEAISMLWYLTENCC
jgi:hypothetical protein